MHCIRISILIVPRPLVWKINREILLSSSLSVSHIGRCRNLSCASRALFLRSFLSLHCNIVNNHQVCKNYYCLIAPLKGNSLLRATINMLIHFGLLLNFRFNIFKKSLRWVISQFILCTSWILTRLSIFLQF